MEDFNLKEFSFEENVFDYLKSYRTRIDEYLKKIMY